MTNRKEPPRNYAEKLLYTEIFDPSIEWPKWSNPNERMLPCDVCGTWTKHVKSVSGWWTCGCGDLVEEHQNVRNP